jgi:hypothetical protein
MNGKIHGKQILNNTILKTFNGLTSSSQYLTTSDDSNVTLKVNSLSYTHSLEIGWKGLLSINRGGLNNATFNGSEILSANQNADKIISSGYKFNDFGTSSNDVWSAQKIIDYLSDFSFTIKQPITPLVELNSNTIIEYKQQHIENVLNFSYEIKTQGAAVNSVLLEWRSNNQGNWNTLSSNASITTFTHILDNAQNINSFNYRYTVTDTEGASGYETKTITSLGYLSPIITFDTTIVNKNHTFETDFLRESSNVETLLSGTFNKRTQNTEILGWKYQYKTDGDWIDINPIQTNINPNGTIPSLKHIPNFNIPSIKYRLVIIDDIGETYDESLPIEFKNLVFWGVGGPTSSNGVRQLSNKYFSNSNKDFNLSTGTESNVFSIAIPDSRQLITSVDNTSFVFWVTYILSNDLLIVNDYYGHPHPYKVYTFRQAVPYDRNHNHLLTLN